MRESTYGRVMISKEGPVNGISEEVKKTIAVEAQSEISEQAQMDPGAARINETREGQEIQVEAAEEAMSIQEESQVAEQEEPSAVDEMDRNHKKSPSRKSNSDEAIHTQLGVSETKSFIAQNR
jgi:hypothetical protein